MRLAVKRSVFWTAYGVLILSYFWINCTGSKETRDGEFRLRNDILKNHSASTLPSFNKTTPLVVKVGLALRQILDVDEKNQIIVTNIWFRLYWKDYILTWNASDYQGATELHLTKKEVWVPDIALYNTASDHGILYKRLDTQIVVNNHGDAQWLAPVQLKSECKINVKYFPFDEQICEITFGSWTYHGSQVDLFPKIDSADLTSFVENTEWEIIEAPLTKRVVYYGCCPQPYPSITVNIRIRRKALFYLSNLVIPCAVIALLASLAFLLPTNNGERISLVVTVLLSLTVYMLIVSETMPATSEVVPLIGKFYISTMILIALTLVAVCITLNCYEKEAKMPRWLHRLLFDYLSRLVCVTRPAPNSIGHSATRAFVVANGVHTTAKQDRSAIQKSKVGNAKDNDDVPTLDYKENLPEKKESGSILDDAIPPHRFMGDEKEVIKTEWKTGSRILDRVFFLVFLVSFLLMTIIVFFEAPNISLT